MCFVISIYFTVNSWQVPEPMLYTPTPSHVHNDIWLTLIIQRLGNCRPTVWGACCSKKNHIKFQLNHTIQYYFSEFQIFEISIATIEHNTCSISIN